ncbi:unnamed protein product [Didymodactylos carnosus]|uniref:Calponin-homology (CH) domain-containing protein n=1 Tax=Didymodactylos carnosus TaxID=1234261 RepID=A0A814E236_9BILA|nr:unnamed protein product [Didymodactylos carnosus]CAF1094883.1 unnamed protein product [Didymodactylos carnosus]CAF3738706.1 unnamed protein product [Didymodactylos carnosus]CAF3856378.1 unnamed protein product [Didymodactylos carnosus]
MSRESSPHYQMAAHYDILAWLDTIPLSRPVRGLDIDFADGVLIAEIIGYFFPEYVDIDIFIPARNMIQRTKNWRLLNTDVLPKLSLHAPGTVVHDITNGDRRAIELFILHLREKIEEHLIRTGRKSRLHWETWRSYNTERRALPMIVPRTPRYFPSLGRLHPREYGGPGAMYGDYDELRIALRTKDDELDVLRGKLKRCEKIIRTKDHRIQELEEKLEKFKPKRPDNQ